ncbi:hypothetical protein B9G55_12285 [Saccharibacillus sp. O16]|nr:hypothetical protein B9G55_12285 [Saccharibacillus sp. O16]
MIFQLFKIEFKRHFYALAGPFFFSAAFGLLFSFRGSDEIYSVINLLIRIAIGIYFPIYVYRDLMKRLFYRTDLLPQLPALRASSLLFIQFAALGCWALLLWNTTMIEAVLNPVGLYTARIQLSSSPLLGVFYLILSKSVSIGCQLALIALGISLSLIVASRPRASFLVRAAVPLLLCFFLFFGMQFYVPGFSNWMIGSNSTAALPQYAGFLAVTFENFGAAPDISDTIQWTSVGINFGVTLVALMVVVFIIGSPTLESRGEQHA